jgi:fatty-acyl-CoA synthase
MAIEIRSDRDASGVLRPMSYVLGDPLGEAEDFGTLTLPAFLRDVTARYATREAVVLRTGSEEIRWTYRALWDHASEVARALIAAGVGKDSRVGILMTNRPEWIAAAFGIAMAGGVVVALNTFSTPSELARQLEISAASIVLFERKVARTDFLDVLTGLEPAMASGASRSVRFPFLRRLVMLGDAPPGSAIESWTQFIAGGRDVPVAVAEAIAASITPADTGGLFFTSGSTGQAKAVLSRQLAMAIACYRYRWAMRLEGDVRAWSPNGFFWSGNFAILMGSTLAAGGAVILQPTFNAAEALTLIATERVTIGHCWPHQWAQLKASPAWAGADLSSLTYVTPTQPAAHHPSFTGATRLPARGFGCSETFTMNTVYLADTPIAISGTSHGVPMPGNIFKIVDPDTGETLPLGESGEIALKGPTLMIGYVGVSPEDTFDEHGFYHTGDKGRLDEKGRLFFEGRLKEMLKSGGANVAPAEIDQVLVRHPDVGIVRTVGVPHATLGEMIVSCVVPVEGSRPDEEALRSFLKDELAAYKIPRRILFLAEHDLPLTGASSKIKSNALRDIAIARLEAEGAQAA